MVIIVLVSVQVVLNLIGTSQLEPSFAIIIVVVVFIVLLYKVFKYFYHNRSFN